MVLITADSLRSKGWLSLFREAQNRTERKTKKRWGKKTLSKTMFTWSQRPDNTTEKESEDNYKRMWAREYSKCKAMH